MIMISVTLGQRPEVGFEEDRHEENKQTIHRYISSSSSVIFPFFFFILETAAVGTKESGKGPHEQWQMRNSLNCSGS